MSYGRARLEASRREFIQRRYYHRERVGGASCQSAAASASWSSSERSAVSWWHSRPIRGFSRSESPPTPPVISILALPASLETPPTYQTSYVYANDGKTLITSFYDENRRDVHAGPGVHGDAAGRGRPPRTCGSSSTAVSTAKAILRALIADQQSGQTTQGASTLTMQYVRNVLKTDPSLTPEERAAAVEDSIGRKIQEARYCDRAGTEAVQGRDPRAVHEHRLLRPGRVWGLRGRADLLLHDAGQADPAAGDACWPASSSRRTPTTRSTATWRRPGRVAATCSTRWSG